MEITQKARERAKALIRFIDQAPTAYQATEQEKAILEKAGFTALDSATRWELKPHTGYYVEISDATILAFRTADKADAGFHIIGAHNDSPGFQLKQNVNRHRAGYGVLNVEPYGGLIMRSWLDRPLSIAGRLLVKDGNGGFTVRKIRIERPLLILPSLAIHMDREVNAKGEIKPQSMMEPLWCTEEEGEHGDFLAVVAKEVGVAREEILDYDLFLYDIQKGVLLGEQEEFISIGRLDNLAMCHAAVTALSEAETGAYHQVIALHDHEEIGSMTRKGADSATLRNVLARLVRGLGGDAEDFDIATAKSFTISCDMAHAVHPNFSDVADPTNQPRINHGPVLKYAASKSYITDGEGGARVRLFAEKAGVTFQTFHNHSDKRGGATIGSMDEQWTTILNADVGNPVLGMHSVRELTGVADHDAMIRTLTAFLSDAQ